MSELQQWIASFVGAGIGVFLCDYISVRSSVIRLEREADARKMALVIDQRSDVRRAGGGE